MCDTCPAHIPGPGEVTVGLLGLLGAAVMSKPGRRVLFWGFCIPMLPFAVVGIFGWWTIAIVAVLGAVSAAGLTYGRVLHRHALVVAPASLRAALPAPRRRVALPRAMVRSLTAPKRALPAHTKALPAAEPVITGTVVAAPVRGKVVR